jgi:activator of HSP90 ATPase
MRYHNYRSHETSIQQLQQHFLTVAVQRHSSNSGIINDRSNSKSPNNNSNNTFNSSSNGSSSSTTATAAVAATATAVAAALALSAQLVDVLGKTSADYEIIP